MPHSPQVESSAGAIRKLWEKHGIKEPLRFLAFCLSLLPIPVIPQAAQALDRHLGDKAFDEELTKVWGEISALNNAVAKVPALEDAIAEIAKVVEGNEKIQANVQQFLRGLGTHQKEFISIVEDRSYQQIIHALVKAESAYFITRTGSTNSIENTTVNAERTVLHTSGGSKNFVNHTTFQGTGGAVSMHGISTQGNISVQGSSVGFGGNSALIFGGNPFLVSGSCPFCNHRIEVDRRALAGYTNIECPNCRRSVPFQMPHS